MALLTALRDDTMPSLPGCPLAIVDDAILKTVIDFCNRSRAYRYSPASIDVVANTATYVPTLPSETEIAWLLSAEIDDVPIDTPTPGSVPILSETDTGVVFAAVVASTTQLGLRNVPDESATLNVRLALRPTLAATEYPDALHVLYRDAIASGVLAKLFAQPKKPWSAPEMVAYYKTAYESGISAAEYRADRGSSDAPARTSLSLIGGR